MISWVKSMCKTPLSYLHTLCFKLISTTCYVTNRVLIRHILKLISYEIYLGRKLSISHLHVFICKYFILNNENDNLGKFDSKLVGVYFLVIPFLVKVFKFITKWSGLPKNLYTLLIVEVKVIDYTCILEKIVL